MVKDLEKLRLSFPLVKILIHKQYSVMIQGVGQVPGLVAKGANKQPLSILN